MVAQPLILLVGLAQSRFRLLFCSRCFIAGCDPRFVSGGCVCVAGGYLGRLRRDLVTIRFKGEYNGVAFDDLFKVEEPYFYRIGSGNILKVRSVASHVFLVSLCVHMPLAPTRMSSFWDNAAASGGRVAVPLIVLPQIHALCWC